MRQHLPELLECIEADWRGHAADGFQWLSRIPSRTVAATCEAFRANPAKYDRGFLLRYARGELSKEERTDLWNEYLKVSGSGFRYKPLSEWKPGFKYQLDHGEWSAEERHRLDELWRQIADVETPNATDIRKTLRPILISEFGVRLASEGGGLWSAGLSIKGTPVVLVFDFGGFSRGFRHQLRLPLKQEGSMRALLSYESALGFNVPPWDLLRTDVLAEQLNLTVAVIKRVLGWLELIDWSTKELDTP